MVKRILFIIACALNITMTLHAQTFTESEKRHFWNIAAKAIEGEINYYGLTNNLKISVGEDFAGRAYVITYKLRSSSAFKGSDILKAFNIEDVKDRVLIEFIKSYMDDDKTGKQLESFVNRLKRLGISIKVKCQYKKKEKSATATPAEIQRLASLLY